MIAVRITAKIPIPIPNHDHGHDDSVPARVGVLFAEAQQPVPERLHHEELLQARVHVARVAQVTETNASDRAPLA